MSNNTKIDLDKGNEIWNERNPDLRQQTRQDIYDNERISKKTIQNLKSGNIGKSFQYIINYLDRLGLKFEDILIRDKDE